VTSPLGATRTAWRRERSAVFDDGAVRLDFDRGAGEHDAALLAENRVSLRVDQHAVPVEPKAAASNQSVATRGFDGEKPVALERDVERPPGDTQCPLRPVGDLDRDRMVHLGQSTGG
jgi:hypothetical protein